MLKELGKYCRENRSQLVVNAIATFIFGSLSSIASGLIVMAIVGSPWSILFAILGALAVGLACVVWFVIKWTDRFFAARQRSDMFLEKIPSLPSDSSDESWTNWTDSMVAYLRGAGMLRKSRIIAMMIRSAAPANRRAVAEQFLRGMADEESHA